MNSIKNLVMNLVVIVLAIILVITLIFAGRELYDAFQPWMVKEYTFMYEIEGGRYGNIVDSYHRNVGSKGKEQKGYEEYYGVAKYYEAAFFYKMYEDAGDTDRAEKHKEAMAAAAAQMGDFAYLTEDINTKLGIQF